MSNSPIMADLKNAPKKSEAALRSLVSMQINIRSHDLPLSLQLELFNRMIVPVLTFGCEAWGYGNNEILEKVQLRFCKDILKCKTTTNTCMVHGELGVFPVDIAVKERMIGYWAKLVTGKETKLAVKMYSVMYRMHIEGEFSSPWLLHIKTILENCGMANIWQAQTFPNVVWLKKAVRLRLQDQFIQQWQTEVFNSDKCILYRAYKEVFGFEDYLNLPTELRVPLCKLRMSNHKLAVERGRYRDIPRNERVCDLCDANTLGDEFHFLLKCSKFENIRKYYIPRKYWRRPNIISFCNLLNCKLLKVKLAKFVKEAFKSVGI